MGVALLIGTLSAPPAGALEEQKGEAAALEKSDEGEPVSEKKTKKEKLLPAAI